MLYIHVLFWTFFPLLHYCIAIQQGLIDFGLFTLYDVHCKSNLVKSHELICHFIRLYLAPLPPQLNHYFCLKVTWGLVLQFIFALVILRWPLGQSIIKCIGEKIGQFLGFTNDGSSFIFGYLVTQKLFDENRLSNDSIAYKCSPCSFIQILSRLYHYFVSILS